MTPESRIASGPSQLPDQGPDMLSLSLDLQPPTPLFLPSLEHMSPERGLLPGFNVMDLFGAVVPSDQYVFYDTS
ncbi:hypothetical protein EYZ11_006628 [Aspergillus tanneri]|nr:hypothetical protein EYZ11_006628 [Aspergillus tanneri]